MGQPCEFHVELASTCFGRPQPSQKFGASARAATGASTSDVHSDQPTASTSCGAAALGGAAALVATSRLTSTEVVASAPALDSPPAGSGTLPPWMQPGTSLMLSERLGLHVGQFRWLRSLYRRESAGGKCCDLVRAPQQVLCVVGFLRGRGCAGGCRYGELKSTSGSTRRLISSALR